MSESTSPGLIGNPLDLVKEVTSPEPPRGGNLLALTVISLAVTISTYALWSEGLAEDWALVAAIGGFALFLGIVAKALYWLLHEREATRDRSNRELKQMDSQMQSFRNSVIIVQTAYRTHMIDFDTAVERLEETYRAASLRLTPEIKKRLLTNESPRIITRRKAAMQAVAKGRETLARRPDGKVCLAAIEALEGRGHKIYVLEDGRNLLVATDVDGQAVNIHMKRGQEMEGIKRLARLLDVEVQWRKRGHSTF